MNILTMYPKSKAPYNVTIYKGSNQAALTRAFVLYFLYRYSSFLRKCTIIRRKTLIQDACLSIDFY